MKTSNTLGLVAAAAGAAAIMYYFDPDMGAQRRARLLALATGMREENTHPLWSGGDPDDGKLRDAVMARVGNVVSHPGSIDAEVQNCCVRLTGDVLASEIDGLLLQVRDVPGVKRVVNALTVHSGPQTMARKASESANLDESLQGHPS